MKKQLRETIPIVLGNSQLDYGVIENNIISEQSHTEIEKWVNVIYSYQKTKYPKDEKKSDGYIDPEKDTATFLNYQVKEKLKNINTNNKQ